MAPSALGASHVLLIACCVALPHTPRLLDAGCCEYLSYDDPANFVHNRFVQQLSWPNIRWALTDGVILGVWEPVSLLFRMGYQTALGAAAAACLRVNLALHAANACAVYLLLAQRAPRHARRGSDGAWRWCCCLSALCFGLHPLCTEVVCWASAQGYGLSGLLALTAVITLPPAPSRSEPALTEVRTRAQLAAHAHAARAAGGTQGSCAGFLWRSAACLCYGASVLAKPAALPLPALCLSLDYHEALCDGDDEGGWRKRVCAAGRALRLNIATLAMGCGLAWVAASVNPDLGGARAGPDAVVSPLPRAGVAVATQLRKLVAPSPLSVRYRWSAEEQEGLGWVCCAVIATLTLLAAWAALVPRACGPRRRSVLGLGWLCYVALVLPSTGLFVQHGVVTLGADRYAYLPLLLLAAPALATALHSIATAEEAAHAEAPRRFPRGTYGELCLLVLGGLVLAYGGRATAEYGMVWKDSLSLWRHVVDVDPGDAVAHGDLANAILAADAAGGPRPGEQSEAALREALAAYDRGVELLPSVGGEGHAVGRGADIWSNRGLVLAALDRKPEAIRCYEHATSAAGGGFSNAATESAAYTNWAVALRGSGRDREVVRKLQRAVELSPLDASGFGRLAAGMKVVGRHEDEVAAYDSALSLVGGAEAPAPGGAEPPRSALADAALAALLPSSFRGPVEHVFRLNRAVALERLERQADALAAYDELLALAPNYARAHANRATVLYQLSARATEALSEIETALDLADEAARAEAGPGDRAGDVIDLQTRSQWLNNRGYVLSAMGDARHLEAVSTYREAVTLEEASGMPESERRASANLARHLGRVGDALARKKAAGGA